MSEAELKIRHISYPITSKREAFAYNFLEGLGRAAGWAAVIGFAALVIGYTGDDESGQASPQTTINE
jgi:hypothetical protein